MTLAGYVDDDADVPRYLSATDICLCLRWPTMRETSATWLRALAAGKATIITDLVHNHDVPVLSATAAWTRSTPVVHGGASPAPVAVAIDICDEGRSLPAAMLALLRNADLRQRLGAAARPPGRPALPPHLDDDGGRSAQEILKPFGVMPNFLRRDGSD